VHKRAVGGGQIGYYRFVPQVKTESCPSFLPKRNRQQAEPRIEEEVYFACEEQDDQQLQSLANCCCFLHQLNQEIYTQAVFG